MHATSWAFPFLSSLASQPACALIPIPIDSRQPEPKETRGGGAVLELATRRPLSRLRSMIARIERDPRAAESIREEGRPPAPRLVRSLPAVGRRDGQPPQVVLWSAPVVPARPEFAPCMYLVLQISSNEIIG